MKIGQDVECFLQTMEGQLVSAIGRVGGTKWRPMPIKGLPQGFTLQEDNVAIEFGSPPASSAEELVDYIHKCLDAGLNSVAGEKLRYSNLSCAIFPESEMEHPKAHEFGCEPDFNAWTGKVNLKPMPPHPFMRSAGGHIHVETWLPKKPAVQAMDLFVSIPAVIMDAGHERKQLYGKAGAYRPKSYGLEYRTPSNFWIFDDQLIRWVWRQTEKAMQFTRKGHRLTGADADNVVSAVNENNREKALALISKYSLELV